MSEGGRIYVYKATGTAIEKVSDCDYFDFVCGILFISFVLDVYDVIKKQVGFSVDASQMAVFTHFGKL